MTEEPYKSKNDPTGKFQISKFDTKSKFILDHFAGLVEYNANGWVEKNKNTLFSDLEIAVRKTKIEFLQQLFPVANPSVFATSIFSLKHANSSVFSKNPESPAPFLKANSNSSLVTSKYIQATQSQQQQSPFSPRSMANKANVLHGTILSELSKSIEVLSSKIFKNKNLYIVQCIKPNHFRQV